MQKDRPFVSVVIPFYKRLYLAKVAILSILSQRDIDQEDVEIIISDDEGSSKKRKENKKFFKNISKAVVYTNNTNEEGPGGNRQTGFSLARGKYILFLDSDDRLRPSFIFEMSRVLEGEKDKVGAVCLSKSVFEPGFKLWERIKLIPLTIIRDAGLSLGYLFNRKSVFPSSFYLCQISHMMFRGKVIRNQRFNYDYRHGGEDWDFFVQTLQKGRIRVVPKRLLLFRYSLGSSTDDPLNKEKKWKSYTLLAKRLPERFKRGIFYKLFLKYISLFGGKNVKK